MAEKKMLKKLADQLIAHEGLRLKPYLCPAGKLTIGVGRNLEDRGITEKEARLLLENDEVGGQEFTIYFYNLVAP